ncbi:MAG: tRNA dihydrouridine synthase DusB [Elusimicrobia bacterium]|nr:tRNA dihydrouridine synthase DusB [Elusimicrobiota bacterium]
MLRIGSLVIESGVLQSPMADCTDLAFRLIGREMGLEFAFLEMVSARSLLRRNAKTLDMMKTAPQDRPLGVQLFGADPGLLAEAAAAVEGMGFDLLDINCGCPVPKVIAGGAGAAMLKTPGKAEAIFKSVVRAIKRIPVTVKTRTGFDDASGWEAVELARRAQGAGIAALTVHGRTRSQRYAGKADWAAIGRVKAAVSIPVIGNGSVMSGADALALREASSCDGVMIGRGALGNPWLYREARAALKGEAPRTEKPSLDDRRSVALEHLELEVRFEGERRAALNMRRIAAWYFPGFPGAAAFRAGVCASKSSLRIRELIEGFGR